MCVCARARRQAAACAYVDGAGANAHNQIHHRRCSPLPIKTLHHPEHIRLLRTTPSSPLRSSSRSAPKAIRPARAHIRLVCVCVHESTFVHVGVWVCGRVSVRACGGLTFRECACALCASVFVCTRPKQNAHADLRSACTRWYPHVTYFTRTRPHVLARAHTKIQIPTHTHTHTHTHNLCTLRSLDCELPT